MQTITHNVSAKKLRFKRLRAICILAISAIAISASASAIESNLPKVSAIPATVMEGDKFSLLLTGTSPDGCGLARDSVKITGEEITVVFIRAGGSLGICTQVLTPFSFPISVFDAGTAAKAGTYKVRIELAPIERNSQTVNKLLAFALVPVTPFGKRPILPESGQWSYEEGGPHATSGSGVGFNIERQDQVLVNISSLYGGDGSPEWYINSGTLVANTLSSELFSVNGGQSLFGAYKPVKEVQYSGNVHLEFNSPVHGTAWFTQPIDEGLISGLKLMPISIARFSFGFGVGARALTTRWALVGEGASAIQGSTLLLADIANPGNTAWRYVSGDYQLNCELYAARPALLPKSCSLTKSGVSVANFDQIGYSRMRGSDAAGLSVSMFRLD